jgi:hypothetical protein
MNKLAGGGFPQAASIQCSRLTSLPGQSLFVVDRAGDKLHIIDSFKQSRGKPRIDASSMIDLAVEGGPVAALGMRLTPDALDDLVILRKGQVAPAVAPTAPLMTFTVMNTNDTGADSLRAAIAAANANAGLDAIAFAVGSGSITISPMTSLPTITEAVMLDGTTQPGFAGDPIVEIAGMGGTISGLTITGGNCVVRGLVINRFSSSPGIFLHPSGSGGNIIENNFLGTNLSGTMAAGNQAGIEVDVPNNTIGGTAAGAGNLASGNGFGITIAGGPTTTGNQVVGNFVGVEINSAFAVPNTFDGVLIAFGASNNTVGGTTPSARNTISGNMGSGVFIQDSGTTGNLIQRNFIGTDSTGAMALGNGQDGVTIDGSSGNTVGGPLGGNSIAGNMLAGVSITGGASLNIVRENLIGVNVSGIGVPNGVGVEIIDSPNNTIGGTMSTGRNTISGNNGNGVNILGAASTGNTVKGNFIGTDVDAAGPLANGGVGVLIDSGASGNTIGGTAVDEGNIISGNAASGILINDALSSGNTIVGNIIGADSSGVMALSNGGNGVTITGAVNNTIGGTATAAGNIIAFNNGAHGGVGVISGTSNRVLGNSIFSNTELGINLSDDLVTPNDAGDGDTGANNRQNFPVLATAMANETAILIKGTLNSTANTTFRIEFFSSGPCDTCDPSGFGEGERFIGSTMVTTDGSGNAVINALLSANVAFSAVVTATATDPAGNTSEFSNCAAVTVLACAITCPADQTAQTGPNDTCGTRVAYPAPQIIGDCGTVNCTPPSGSFFQVGSTQVTCITEFGPSCSFNLIVEDRTRPQITCPGNVTAKATAGQTSAVVNYPAPTASDNCPFVLVSCSPPSGNSFPLGATTVNCQARDEAINESGCSFTVTVNDSNAPTIQCPANIVMQAPAGQTSAIVNYPPPTVTDNRPGATATCAPASGSSFPLGVTTVACTAVDTDGNRAMCAFTITINSGPPTGRVTIDGGKNAVEFGAQAPVTPRRKPPRTDSPCSFFTVENTGSIPLTLTYVAALRTGNAVTSGRITDANERGTYTLSRVSSEGEQEVPPGTVITIGVRQSVRFCLRFDPLIPGVVSGTNNLIAPQVISDFITSVCNFTIQGGPQLSVNVEGNVADTLMLINPDNPRKKPVVTFARSGNEFILTYSVFDPDLDTALAIYKLLNSSGQTVGQPIEVDLAEAIRQTNLLRGQSFTVEQRFTGANSHPEITGCDLTVRDGEGSVSKRATPVSSSAGLRRHRLTVAPPTIKVGR